jgi:hypothetical protein
MARQSFQRGQMIWRSDNRTIYLIDAKHRWRAYEDRWAEGQPESDPAIVAPPGIEQPLRGFGKVWREQLGGAQADVGWAVEKERGLTGIVQAWDLGMVFRFGGETLILFNNGLMK